MTFDIVFPHDNEAELASMAKRLGTTKLLMLYEPTKVPATVPAVALDVSLGVVCTAASVEKLLSGQHQLALISSERDRLVFERRKVPAYIIGLGESELGDKMHQRESGLNQPLLRELQKKGVTVILSVDKLLSSSGQERAQLMGRWMQNVILCRKYKVPVLVASCAKMPYGLRSAHDRQSVGIVLGLQPKEAIDPITN